MPDFTGAISGLRSVGVIYWLFALAALLGAIYIGKGWMRKAGGAVLVLAAFGYVPVENWHAAREREIFAREAWAHFKRLCAEKSGEKIYKSYSGVKSVLVTKPLPPASDMDHFDQYWYGDPYSRPATSERSEVAMAILAWSKGPVSPTGIGPGFDFVESVVLAASTPSKRYIRVTYPLGARDYVSAEIDRPVSRFAIAWEDISTPHDRTLWVAGSRFSVIDLSNNSLVAERIGYFIESGFGSRAGGRRPWLSSRSPRTTCPAVHDYTDRWFLLKVLRPAS